MKTQLALSLLVAAVLSSCTTVKTTPTSANAADQERAAYAATSPTAGTQPLKESDVIAEGPGDLEANPALLPTPLLRRSAASGL